MVQLGTVHIMLDRDRNLESGFFFGGVELQRDFGHFGRFDNSVGRPEDWCSDLSGGGVLGD